MINERGHIDDNGFVSQYWYDADGERTVKTFGDGTVVYVNSLFSGGNTQTAKFILYVSPYLVASQGGKYTKHIYVGSQRIVSKLGDLQSYGADPRRIPYAGSESDNINVDYKGKYTSQQQSIKNNYTAFDVPYNGKDNDDYVDGDGFCCDDIGQGTATRSLNPGQNDNYEQAQFYYHPDHLGSSSFITNLDGDVTQHIEYVPFGEVFIEERNNVWNTPYLFNAKELDEETGLYYYGARYYNPRISIWISVDPKAAEMPEWSPYSFSFNNPIIFIDPDGMKPTPSQAASMAWHIYDGKKGQVVDGWTLSNVYTDENNPGYKSGLYTREVDGVMEYTMVNMGTIPGIGKKNRDSMSENLEQPFGGPEHMKLSLDKARELNNTLGPDADLTFVGHSKGGAEATANAVATNRDAYVFNPAAVNLKAYGLSSKDYTASMTAFVVKGDPVAATYS